VPQSPIWPDDGVILYDGVCVLCSGWVRFIVNRDAARRFRFTPIQSAYGRQFAITLGLWFAVTGQRAPATARLRRVALHFVLPNDMEISNEPREEVDVMLRGGNLFELWPDVAALLAFTLVMMTLAILRFRKRLD